MGVGSGATTPIIKKRDREIEGGQEGKKEEKKGEEWNEKKRTELRRE